MVAWGDHQRNISTIFKLLGVGDIVITSMTVIAFTGFIFFFVRILPKRNGADGTCILESINLYFSLKVVKVIWNEFFGDQEP